MSWDPATGTLGGNADGADAVVHLAGASIAEGRWTAARKGVLRDSRVAATNLLIDSFGKLARPPRVFIGASAIGFYGDRGDEELTESSPPGADFLADLTAPMGSGFAAGFGIRGACRRPADRNCPRQKRRRTASGGMPFRFGAGGRLGTGRQWMSWLALEELVAMIQFALAGEFIDRAS